jgi:preprotein translocase subunit SecG
MYTFLLVILVLVSIALVCAILLQSGKGGGLSANFGGAGTSEFMGTRQAGTWLTKGSWYLGGAFLFLSFVLSLMSTRSRTPRSILDQPLAPVTSPAPATKGQAPAVPLEPLPLPPATPSPTP